MRWLRIIHRWLGTVMCLMFAVWFASGIVLMFVPFPSLSGSDRFLHSLPIDLNQVQVTPAQVIELSHIKPERVRLVQVGHKAAYILQDEQGINHVFSAKTGQDIGPVTAPEAAYIGEMFSGETTVQTSEPFNYDQWIVHQQFDPYRPFYRIDVGDPANTELYVSQVTGQVLQRTTGYERGWNWVGAVTHWIYPTILRQSFFAWNQLVWFWSLLGVVTVVAGLVVGLRYSRRKKLSPYQGWKRWHHILGLVFGVVIFNWIFSGWLSMDHGRIFPKGDATNDQIALFRGVTLADASKIISLEVIHGLGRATEIELSAVAGESFLIVRGPDAARVVEMDQPPVVLGATPSPLIFQAVSKAWPDFKVTSAGAGNDDIYTRAEDLPPTAGRYIVADGEGTWVHVDLATGQIVSVMNFYRRIYCFIYYGLHTFNFPCFSAHPLLRQILMLPLLIGGLVFSLTGAILGLNRVGALIRETFRRQLSLKAWPVFFRI